MSIVITGATGQLGTLVVKELLGRGVPATEIVAAGRSVQKLAELEELGVRTAEIDYDQPASIEAAFNAGDTVLLISGNDIVRRREQHKAVIEAAGRAGVGHLAYTSVLQADSTPLVLAPDHADAEKHIKASGIPFTLLRHGWYTENYVPTLQQAAATGAVLASAGDGRVASATRADYAAAIATVLTTPGHLGAIYELSGDYAWDFNELADAIASVVGREVSYTPLDAEEHVAVLQEAGLDAQTAGFVAALDGNIRDGALAHVTGELSRLAGRPTTPLVDGLRPYASAN
ncbi:SDR family oxidoreductase [Arthrobacter sp. M4]|uniref:SDR family oxidoreductase n=1 Tax=Arthrobacter sp. M4 TaxID=218160 RepID=UPI001CDD1867|nr:SDR family oxidoreductase [Arthrobacter sp. M4]MCA4133395.1 SDR family oxidoreductase [Arthrobacter sp. M4]